MTAHIDTLAKVFDALIDWQNAAWSPGKLQYRIGKDVGKRYERLATVWQPVRREQIEKYFRDNGHPKPQVGVDLLQSKECIYLPMPRHNTKLIPLLSFSIQLGPNSPRHLELRLRLILVDCSLAWKMCKPKGLAFRLEHGEGRHCYYHVQPCRDAFDGAKASLPDVEFPDWVQESIPALPVKAQDVSTLLLCLIVGVYGATGEFISDLIGKVPELRPALKQIVGAKP